MLNDGGNGSGGGPKGLGTTSPFCNKEGYNSLNIIGIGSKMALFLYPLF